MALSPSGSTIGIHPEGYRLPATTTLGRVRLQVADLQRSISFYEHVIGLRVLDHSNHTATLGTGEDNGVLMELVERAGVRSVAPRSRLGLFHVAILLPSRSALARFVHHLARMDIRAGMSDHLVSEAIYLRAPDGLGLEVYADRPRSAWQQQDNQLVMSTEPLDVQSLLRVTSDTSWSRAPAGTVIGHVHLHVGDLKEAAALYHRALGLDKMVWNYPGALFLSAGGYHHHLAVNTWAGSAAPPADDEAQLLEWSLVLPGADDLEAAVHSLEEAGYTTTQEVPSAQEATSHLVRDPWGTLLRLRATP